MGRPPLKQQHKAPNDEKRLHNVQPEEGRSGVEPRNGLSHAADQTEGKQSEMSDSGPFPPLVDLPKQKQAE